MTSREPIDHRAPILGKECRSLHDIALSLTHPDLVVHKPSTRISCINELAPISCGTFHPSIGTPNVFPKSHITSIEGIEWTFMILFFTLAGASLELDSLRAASLLDFAYIMFRLIGLVRGAWVGSIISKVAPAWRRWMGIALWPQAGVALGMALLASQHRPGLKEVILPVVIGSTIIFELIGPVMTRKTRIKVGEGQVTMESGLEYQK